MRLTAALFAGLCFIVAVHSESARTLIRLPGTQPGQVTPAGSFRDCASCHETIVRDWSGSTMAHAPKDPVFNTLLSITTKKTLPLGLDTPEYCLRCHSPSGWLAGRSHELSVENLYGTDLDGVHCDFCHRAVDPLSPDPGASTSGDVPGYGNGMFVVMPSGLPRRGPRPAGPAGHPVYRDGFMKKSEFCAVCHDVSNPHFAPDPSAEAPSVQPALERTYSEWRNSWYATQGEAGTCQACHMPKAAGYSASPGRLRLDVAGHRFSGSNTFVPGILHEFWEGVDTSALREGAGRSLQMHRQAATLEVAAGRRGESSIALVRVTNLTGHKLPTGFAEGRRMWIAVKGKDVSGGIVFESGSYDTTGGVLIRDTQLRTYEADLGPTAATAAFAGIAAEPSFQPAFSDSVYADSRIPPRGFSWSTYRECRAEPAGASYGDGQYWDLAQYEMPSSVVAVDVALCFQQVTGEFAAYLRDENAGNPYDWNDWGGRLHDAWRRQGTPVMMATVHASVQQSPPALPGVRDAEIPLRAVLAQNYPNPFNGSSTIELWLSTSSATTLSVYDVTGREVLRLLDGTLGAGLHSASVSSSGLASGVYLYRLTAGGSAVTRKLVVLR